MTIKQKLLSFDASDTSYVNEKYLSKGWVVKQMIAENVSVSSSRFNDMKGRIVVLLEIEV